VPEPMARLPTEDLETFLRRQDAGGQSPSCSTSLNKFRTFRHASRACSWPIGRTSSPPASRRRCPDGGVRQSSMATARRASSAACSTDAGPDGARVAHQGSSRRLLALRGLHRGGCGVVRRADDFGRMISDAVHAVFRHWLQARRTSPMSKTHPRTTLSFGRTRAPLLSRSSTASTAMCDSQLAAGFLATRGAPAVYCRRRITPYPALRLLGSFRPILRRAALRFHFKRPSLSLYRESEAKVKLF